MLLTLAQMKAKSFESRRNFILPGVDASHVYVRALALMRLLLQSLDSCAEIKGSPSVA